MLRFGQFQLDTSQKRLYQQGVEIPIEPKLFDLLMLLINHSQQLLSREHIVESLWSGRYVTDNAVNKQVANLRKLLSDDPKQSVYIQTVPKVGYRFICPVEKVQVQNRKKGTKSHFKFYVICGLLAVLTIATTIGLRQNGTPEKTQLRHTTEVTRLNGAEWSPIITPDNANMLFLHQSTVDSPIALWHNDLNTKQLKKLADDTNINQLLLVRQAPDNNAIYELYFRRIGHANCGIYRGTIEKQRLQTATTAIINCKDQDIIDAAVDPRGDYIIFSARTKTNGSAQIHQLDLTSNITSLLKQPVSGGDGIVSLDISEDGNKLLLVHVNDKRHSDIYSLALHSNTLTLELRLNYYMAKASWDKNMTGIYYFAPPPANKIKHQLLGSEQSSTVVSASDYLAQDIKLGPDNTLYFTTRNRNFDNTLLNRNENMALNNSSVYDIAPTLFHQQDKYLFISKRTGQCQIFTADFSTGESKILSNFSEYLVIRHLQLSPHDDVLLFSDHTKVWRINAMDLMNSDRPISLKDAVLVHESSDIIINIEWLNQTHFVVTTLNKNKRNLLYNTLNNEHLVLPSKWRHYLTDDQETGKLLVIDADTGDGYFTKTDMLTSGKPLTPAYLTKMPSKIPKKLLHPKLVNNTLSFVTHDDVSAIFNQQSLLDDNLRIRKRLNGYYTYDANATSVVISELVSINGDVHQATIATHKNQ